MSSPSSDVTTLNAVKRAPPQECPPIADLTVNVVIDGDGLVITIAPSTAVHRLVAQGRRARQSVRNRAEQLQWPSHPRTTCTTCTTVAVSHAR